jgi:hypothetical protein
MGQAADQNQAIFFLDQLRFLQDGCPQSRLFPGLERRTVTALQAERAHAQPGDLLERCVLCALPFYHRRSRAVPELVKPASC